MAADVFGSTKKLSGAIQGASVVMTIADSEAAVAGAMVQSVSLQYSRQISRVFELGSENMYYNIGNSEGQGTIQTIVGPASIISGALAKLSDPCKAAEHIVKFKGSNGICGSDAGGGGGGVDVTAKGALLQSTSIQLNAQDFMMQSGGQFMFASLEM